MKGMSNEDLKLIEQHLGKISQSLVRLNSLIEVNLINRDEIIEGENPASLEEEFLMEIITMYRDEAERKALHQKKRKSSKLIQAEIQNIAQTFFSNHLGIGYRVRKYQDAFIVVSKKVDNSYDDVAMIRVVNDLGFMRHRLREWALEPMIEYASQLGISSDNTFLIVLSLPNSLIQNDVREVMGEHLNNKDLFNPLNDEANDIINQYLNADRGLLGLVNDLYEDGTAENHVKFILRASNPNGEGDAMYQNPQYQPELTENLFYEHPLENILEHIKDI